MLAGPEQPVSRIPQPRQNVAVRVQLAVKRRGEDRDVGVRLEHAAHALGGGDEAEEPDALRAGVLERAHGVHGGAAGREHRIEHEEVARVAPFGNLEVVIDGLERVVLAVDPDVPDARRRNELGDPFHHPEAGPQDRHQRELLPSHPDALHRLQGGLDLDGLERQVFRDLVRHQHRDLVDELLEVTGRGVLVPQNRKLVPDQGVVEHREVGELAMGHGREGMSHRATPPRGTRPATVGIGRTLRVSLDDEEGLTITEGACHDTRCSRTRAHWTPVGSCGVGGSDRDRHHHRACHGFGNRAPGGGRAAERRGHGPGSGHRRGRRLRAGRRAGGNAAGARQPHWLCRRGADRRRDGGADRHAELRDPADRRHPVGRRGGGIRHPTESRPDGRRRVGVGGGAASHGRREPRAGVGRAGRGRARHPGGRRPGRGHPRPDPRRELDERRQRAAAVRHRRRAVGELGRLEAAAGRGERGEPLLAHRDQSLVGDRAGGHRVDRRLEGRVGDGHLRQPRRQRRGPHHDQARRPGQGRTLHPDLLPGLLERGPRDPGAQRLRLRHVRQHRVHPRVRADDAVSLRRTAGLGHAGLDPQDHRRRHELAGRDLSLGAGARRRPRLLGGLRGVASLGGGLSLDFSVGANYERRTYSVYFPRSVNEGFSAGGDAVQAGSEFGSLLSENLVRYVRDFGSGHRIDAVGGFTYQTDKSTWNAQEVQGFPDDLLGGQVLQNGTNPQKPQSGSGKSVLASWLGRVNYALRDRYLFTATLRADGSSKFAANNKWAAFPAVAFAWRAIDEPALKRQTLLSDLKLRVSYGKSGNQAIGAYQSLPAISGATLTLNEVVVPAYVVTQLGNPNLRWETTSQVNVGLDFGAWHNRFTGSVDVYRKNTYDLLQQITLAGNTGFGTAWINSGNVINRGFELQASADVLTGGPDAVTWSIGVTVSKNRNRIESLGAVAQQFAGRLGAGGGLEATPFIQKAGLPIGAMGGYRTNGIVRTSADSLAESALQGKAVR